MPANAWFPLIRLDPRLPGDIPKLFPPPGIHEEGRIPPHAWGLLSIIRRPLSRETAAIDRRRGILTKCQTKASTVPFLAPKYDWVDSEALLRRFAKYTLTQIRSKRYHPDTT